MEGFKNYLEAYETIGGNKVKAGDVVKALGLTTTVKEVLDSYFYVETGHKSFKEAKDETKYYVFCDVEFIDTEGVYRHWKSSFDGGYIIHK